MLSLTWLVRTSTPSSIERVDLLLHADQSRSTWACDSTVPTWFALDLINEVQIFVTRSPNDALPPYSPGPNGALAPYSPGS